MGIYPRTGLGLVDQKQMYELAAEAWGGLYPVLVSAVIRNANRCAQSGGHCSLPGPHVRRWLLEMNKRPPLSATACVQRREGFSAPQTIGIKRRYQSSAQCSCENRGWAGKGRLGPREARTQ